MNEIKKYLPAVAIAFFAGNSFGQSNIKPDKVSHAEPLYADFVRDLGARKGEKELNAAVDFASFKNYNEQAFLVEYEFAPVNRLGLEAEADFSFFKRTHPDSEIPDNKLECLRLSAQYSFFVSTRLKTTLAAGYTQIIKFIGFKNYGRSALVQGLAYNPFFIAAKRWGENFHTLVYTGPSFGQELSASKIAVSWQVNTSFFYGIPQTKHFIGVELNKEIGNGKFEMTVRPQVKVRISPKLGLGFVAGIPVNRSETGYSSFLRIIYEP